MRWMWIDRIVDLEPGRRLAAIKHVSLSEDHLHDHFAADPARGLPPLPVMPASLVIEGMAQTAGILVGHAEDFREKVILAKVGRAHLTHDACGGDTLRYTATLERIDTAGASALGVVELTSALTGETAPIGEINLVFSHVDQNMAGVEFPEHNFVFDEGFKTLLRISGVSFPDDL